MTNIDDINKKLEQNRSKKWHSKHDGQWSSANKRQALYYNDPEWTKKNGKKVSSSAEWQAQHKKQLEWMNTDPKIRANKKKAQEVNHRSVTGPQGVYKSVTEFRQKTGLDHWSKIKLLPHLYYYTDEGPGETLYENVYYTPLIVAPSMKMCYDYYIDKGLVEDKWPKLKHKPWIKWFRAQKDFQVKREPKKEWLLILGVPKKG